MAFFFKATHFIRFLYDPSKCRNLIHQMNSRYFVMYDLCGSNTIDIWYLKATLADEWKANKNSINRNVDELAILRWKLFQDQYKIEGKRNKTRET